MDTPMDLEGDTLRASRDQTESSQVKVSPPDASKSLAPNEHTTYSKTENSFMEHTAESSKSEETKFRLGYETVISTSATWTSPLPCTAMDTPMDLEADTPRTPRDQTESNQATVSTPDTSQSLAPDEHTPYSKTENSSGQHTAESSKSEETNFLLGYEAMPKCLGPMPVRSVKGEQNFMDEFLPLPGSMDRDVDMPHFEQIMDAFLSIPERPRAEKALYQPMVDAFNKNSSEFKAVLTDEVSEGGSTPGSLKPDISIYLDSDHVPDSEYTRNGKGYSNFSALDTFIEVKRSKDDDCFCDGPGNLINVDMKVPASDLPPQARARLSTLGQSANYVAEILKRQFRTAVFSIMMFGPWIRLLRWDQSGTIVSEAFNVHEEPQILCEFIWRLEQVGPDTRGYDTTVNKTSDPVHSHYFKTEVQKRLRFELDIDDKDTTAAEAALNCHLDPYQLSKVSGMSDSGGQSNTYIISKPTSTSMSPTGRGTKGYLALEFESKEVGFFKDTWRKIVPGVESEGTITQELFKKEVRNVSNVTWHGDVPTSSLPGFPPQSTRTQDYITAPWVKSQLSKDELRRNIVKHVHYRMFSKTVGCSLHHHKDVDELLSAVRDMVDTVVDATGRCQRMHRDISASNVILVRNPVTKKRTAHIIDWEFSVKEDESKNRCYTISGTWQFISSRLLIGKDKTAHRREDDIESIFWVAYWYLLIYYSELALLDLVRILRGVFDSFELTLNGFTGGIHKGFRLAEPGHFSEGFESHEARHVRRWLRGFAQYLSSKKSTGQTEPPELPDLYKLLDLKPSKRKPTTLTKKTPEWTKIKGYRPPGLSESGPATRSAGLKANWSLSGVIAAGVAAHKAAGRTGGNGVTQEVGNGVYHGQQEEGMEVDGRSKGVKRARVDSGDS